MRTDGMRNITKVIVVFRNFANTSKNRQATDCNIMLRRKDTMCMPDD